MQLSEEIRAYMDHVPTRDGDVHYINEERINRWADRVAELEREIHYLRIYGNKDCVAMADEAMAVKEK